MRAVLAIFFAQALFADGTAERAFRLFKADVESHKSHVARKCPDASYFASALASTGPSVKTAVQKECERKRCARRDCSHTKMTGFIDSAVTHAQKR